MCRRISDLHFRQECYFQHVYNSPALQQWRDIDAFFRQNRHLEMLFLYSVAALFFVDSLAQLPNCSLAQLPSSLPALLFSFCIFALIDPVYDIFVQPVFLRCVIIYIFLLISVGRRVVLNSIS